jgi:signal transduction histidine kinase
MMLLTVAILITVLIVGLVSVRSAESALEERILHSLSAVATSKEVEIVSIVEQDFERVSLIASRTKLRECLVGIEEGDPKSGELVAKMNQILDDALHSVEALQEISAMDTEGKIVASTNRDIIGKDMAYSQFFAGGKEGFYLGPLGSRDGRMIYDVAAPMVHPKEGTFIGVLAVKIELWRLAEVLSDYTGMGETGEFVLGKREEDRIVIMGPLRRETVESAQRSIALDSGTFEPLLNAMAQEEGIAVAQDYQDVEVLAAYQYVDIGDWGLVAKIDTQEAFQPITTLQKRMVLLGSILAVLGIAFAHISSSIISRRIRALQAGVANIASGQLDYRIEVKGQDELEDLGVSFNQMASQLEKDTAERKQAEEKIREYSENLEQKVKERTAELEEAQKALVILLEDMNQAKEELEKANIQLQELDQLKSLFIASMSHELRTPLNSIIGFTGIILQGMTGEITEEQRKQLTMVKSSANHLLDLINDIIDMSKIEAGKVELSIEEFDLSTIVQEVKDSFRVAAAEKGIRLSLKTPKRLVIKSDERRTKQVLMNLVSNAIKFTDRGEIGIKVAKKGGMAEISVSDTGIGIREEDMDKLFRAFSQITNADRPTQEGTGLGLHLSKKIAGLLGGKIWAESEFGRGSVFTFALPLKYREVKT